MSAKLSLPPKFGFTVLEYVAASGFSERSVRKAIAEGKLRAGWSCGQWRIRNEDAERHYSGLPPLPGDLPKPRVINVKGW